MLARWLGLTVTATALAGGAIAGCMLFTGSGDGYSEADGGDSAAPVVDGACFADSGLCIEVLCTSTPECQATSAAQVCCIGLQSATTIGTACQTGSCSLGTYQSCATSAECGEGLSCIEQDCNFQSNGLTFHACGVVPGCAIVSGKLDSGITDASDSG
jgi:hypothetical protein